MKFGQAQTNKKYIGHFLAEPKIKIEKPIKVMNNYYEGDTTY